MAMAEEPEVLDLSMDIETKIVEMLNKALSSESDQDKVESLRAMQTVVTLHDVLDNFLDEILSFQSDPSPDVRYFVVGFIETVFKKDHDYVPRVIVHLKAMLADECPKVLKRVIQVLTQLCRVVLVWMSKASNKEEIETTWKTWSETKSHLLTLLEQTENDGVRTQCIKFVEVLVVSQTRKDEHSSDWDCSVDELGLGHIKCTCIASLEREAVLFFDQLKNFQSKIHISSVNLMATMQSLAHIARQRCKLFFDLATTAFEHLKSNLPPTLIQLQLNSVKKLLKLLFLTLFKHSYVYTSKQQARFQAILASVGATHSEMNRCVQDAKKRGLKVDNISNDVKRMRTEHTSNIETESASAKTLDSKANVDSVLYDFSKKFIKGDGMKALETTLKEMVIKMNDTRLVCDLVISSLQQMPDKVDLPIAPVSDPQGLSAQVTDISKHLAMQMSLEGQGSGMEEMTNRYVSLFESLYPQNLDPEMKKKIISLVKKLAVKELKKYDQHHKTKQVKVSKPVVTTAVKIKHFSLDEITKPMTLEDKLTNIEAALVRITQTKKHYSLSQLERLHKIVAKFFTEFSFIESLRSIIRDYVFQDIRKHHDVLFNALYFEYVPAKHNSLPLDNYAEILKWIIENIIQLCDTQDRDYYLHRFYMEAPFLTQASIQLLQRYIVSDEAKGDECFLSGMTLAKLLIENRPRHREMVLDHLITIVMSTRVDASLVFILTYLKEFYQNDRLNLAGYLEDIAMKYANNILDECPPLQVLTDVEKAWSDVAVERCLALCLALVPLNHKLLHRLASIYTASNDNNKRIILRKIQCSIQAIGMKSTELLALIETCPVGAETLLTRIVSILTEKQQPSIELVTRVKHFYQNRVCDVRFLIPIINGLNKKEIVDILPQLIKLNPIVVKEVFNRLTAPHADSSLGYSSPISPTDLMIALHNIDETQCDLKVIIKTTNLCFEDKKIFNSEVLAVVMQILVEQDPLPTLLMRTVILSLGHFPRLQTLVLNNILQKLILRQVWNYKKVWEGFIRCCQRLAPESFFILLQLPPPQLKAFLEECPAIKPQLAAYLQQDDQHLTLVSRALKDVVFDNAAH